MITGERLRYWADLEDRRRRSGGGPLRSPLGLSALVALALAGEILRRIVPAAEGELYAAVSSASRLWIAIAVIAASVVIFGAPYRLYWRRDAALLARLPVPGKALLSLAISRSIRAAALACLPLGAASAAFLYLDAELAVRHLAALLVAFSGGAFIGPAAALAAGAVVASNKAQALMDSLGGEFQAPKTSWLGILPGVAATAVAVVLVALSPWVIGEEPAGGSGIVWIAIGAAVPPMFLLWALSVADRVAAAAIREVAALDQEILAHVERSTPSSLERAWGRATCSGPGRLVYEKDATLMRRRYPSPYFLLPIGILALWILAAARPAGLVGWSAVVIGLWSAYAVILARRVAVEPIEHPRYLRSLAVSDAAARRAKRAPVYLRALFLAAVAGGPLIASSSDRLGAALVVAGAVLVMLILGLGGAARTVGQRRS